MLMLFQFEIFAYLGMHLINLPFMGANPHFNFDHSVV